MKTLDVDETADFLKVDRTTVLNLAGTGGLPGAKIGRAWVFLLDDLVDYLRGEVRQQQRERQDRAARDAKSSMINLDPLVAGSRLVRGKGKLRALPVLPEPTRQV
jgi:excisionase family DNA binding protein